MRIAFFNWRDIRHPMAGGAESIAHNMLKRVIEEGHKVTIFSSTFPGCLKQETIDGIEHMRYGGRFLIYPKAFLCYHQHVKGNYDIIVESINGMPYFMPIFAKEKAVAFIHQLTRENWYSGLPLPLAFLGFHLEDLLLSVYRDKPVAVPSESTKADLKSLGFNDVTLVHEAVDITPPKNAKKASEPTVICLGRLTKSKRVDHAIKAFTLVKTRFKDARLWIVGSGPEERSLRSLTDSISLSDSVRFFGKVDEPEKASLLSQAHLALFPAVREGWGLVVLEANACRTPVIGYDVPGLQDSIKDGVNGFTVPSGDYALMGAKAISLLEDEKELERLSASARRYNEGFGWDRCVDEFLSFIEGGSA